MVRHSSYRIAIVLGRQECRSKGGQLDVDAGPALSRPAAGGSKAPRHVTRPGDDGPVEMNGDQPRLIRPMLATAGPLPSLATDHAWSYEFKWDGVRAVAYLGGGGLRLLSRTDQDMTTRYPELTALATAVGDQHLILDGEIVALLGGKPSFSTLQQRMQVRRPTPELVAVVPATYVIFDVLHHAGRSLLTVPHARRRALLDELHLAGIAWQTPPAFIGGGADIQNASREQGLEGIVAKRLTSTYQAGRRSRDW